MPLSRHVQPVRNERLSEARTANHRPMLRAGMIEQASAGIFPWLPLGFGPFEIIERIVHEEQQRVAHVSIRSEAFI